MKKRHELFGGERKEIDHVMNTVFTKVCKQAVISISGHGMDGSMRAEGNRANANTIDNPKFCVRVIYILLPS